MSRAVYVGYDLENRRFRDEEGDEISEDRVRELAAAGKLDATMMAMRLVSQFNFDHDALAKFYEEAG